MGRSLHERGRPRARCPHVARRRDDRAGEHREPAAPARAPGPRWRQRHTGLSRCRPAGPVRATSATPCGTPSRTGRTRSSQRQGLVVAVHFPYPTGRARRGHRARQDRRARALPLRTELRDGALPRLVPLPRLRLPPARRGRHRQDGGLHARGRQPHLRPPGGRAVHVRELGGRRPARPNVHDDRPAASPGGRGPDAGRRDHARPGWRPTRRPRRGAGLRAVPPCRGRRSTAVSWPRARRRRARGK